MCPALNEEQPQPRAQEFRPSKKRMALAIYIDLVAFGIVWSYVALLFGDILNDLLIYLAVFTVTEFIFFRKFLSPGLYLLSIYKRPRAPEEQTPDAKGPYVLFVDLDIKTRENWLTILLGILFINSGAKAVGRWTQGVPTFPMFGFDTSTPASIALTVLFGVVSLAIGIGFLKLKRQTIPAFIGYFLITLIGFALSYHQLPGAVEKLVIQRRTVQMGRPVDEREIRFAQQFIPKAIAGGVLLYMAALFAVRKRLTR